jgi:hypothetical protein
VAWLRLDKGRGVILWMILGVTIGGGLSVIMGTIMRENVNLEPRLFVADISDFDGLGPVR